MGIDLSQFLDVFYEESFEGLDTMEELLLGLNEGTVDSESINTIFRAAHSIKGGSATFGLGAVADFTHVLESFLDEMRDGSREVTIESTDLLLKSVDCLREMLTSLQATGECEQQMAKGLIEQIETIGEAETTISADAFVMPSTSESIQDTGNGDWQICFKPESHILCNGNEPLRMFRELSELGACDVSLEPSSIPQWLDLQAEKLFLNWHIHLAESVSKEDILEVFEWVIDECELTINREQPASEAPIAKNDEKTIVTDSNATTETVTANTESATVTEVSKSTAVAKTAQKPKSIKRTSSSIRVGIDKVDSLINLVGELVITQSMLSRVGTEFDVSQLEKLKVGLAQLEHNTRELQESVMQIRMMPISFAFNRFPRMVRDLAFQLDKKIDLIIEGEHTELDKTVLEQIGDPLVHLVRNSLDHGIEIPSERLANGKSETGTVKLSAFYQGGSIIIEISDDGKGINAATIFAKGVEKGLVSASDNLSEQEIFRLLFEPGFSTATTVSDVSGRGVGMDVVKRNISSLGGTIDIHSQPGKGSVFSIRLPLTLAILDGQLIRLGEEIFVVPLISVIESLKIDQSHISKVGGEMDLYQLRDDYVPMIDMASEFGFATKRHDYDESILVVVEGEDQLVGLLVDELLEQQQVVIKSLEENYKSIQGISGATILGDGRVALIVDTIGFIRGAQHYKNSTTDAA